MRPVALGLGATPLASDCGRTLRRTPIACQKLSWNSLTPPPARYFPAGRARCLVFRCSIVIKVYQKLSKVHSIRPADFFQVTSRGFPRVCYIATNRGGGRSNSPHQFDKHPWRPSSQQIPTPNHPPERSPSPKEICIFVHLFIKRLGGTDREESDTLSIGPPQALLSNGLANCIPLFFRDCLLPFLSHLIFPPRVSPLLHSAPCAPSPAAPFSPSVALAMGMPPHDAQPPPRTRGTVPRSRGISPNRAP